ncbi:unnamed protein product [Lathyrus sativus]|nr:unnamed protein product [Lathyrus sativus]
MERQEESAQIENFDLNRSKNLIKMLDFGDIPNLERLNLEGCSKLVQLDPSIGLLRKLVDLNLKYCKSLVSIPSNIFGLSSLKDLNMYGCCFEEFNNTKHLDISETASHSQSTSSICKWAINPSLLHTPTTNTIMFPSLLSICCLCKVDISYCGLSQVPEAIGGLHWLEMLILGGNNFVTLPSLRELSKLVYLNLENCKCLESLPELPFPTTTEQDLQKYKYRRRRAGLFIFNCPKISDKERCSRMTFLWMKQFIQVNKEYHPVFFDIGIIFPGSEIPSWINNQNVGSSIPVSPFMQDKGNNVVGFLCCTVFSLAPHYPKMTRFSEWKPSVHMKLCAPVETTTYLPVIANEDVISVKSIHIWLIYFPWEPSHDDVYDHFCVEIDRNGSLDVEVKKCGYRWVYEKDLQEFNSTTMLALKRKFLAIEDAAQPQSQLHSFR